MPKLHSVQALRGIAALLVLLFHIADVQIAMTLPAHIAERQLLTGFWSQGYSGVDLFFVISGFIMVYVTQTLQPGFKAARGFMRARLSRIYPLWWVFASLMSLYFCLRYGQPASPEIATGQDIVPHLLQSFWLWPQPALPVLGVGWTLIHEMFFYCLFACLLLMPRRTQLAALLIWGGLIIGAMLMMPIPPRAYNLPSLALSPLGLEFILGALIGFIILRQAQNTSGPAMARRLWLGILLLSLIFLIFTLSFARPAALPLILYRLIAFGLPFAALLAAAIHLERADALLVPPFLSRLGDWSYSLYLSHMLVLLALRKIWLFGTPYLPKPLQFLAPGALDNLVFAAACLPAALIIAAISYHYIEQPLLRYSRRALRAL